jgi:LPS sulfotransferase NodH
MKTSFCFKKCKHCGLRGLVFMFQKNYCVVCRQILSKLNRTRVVDWAASDWLAVSVRLRQIGRRCAGAKDAGQLEARIPVCCTSHFCSPSFRETRRLFGPKIAREQKMFKKYMAEDWPERVSEKRGVFKVLHKPLAPTWYCPQPWHRDIA